MEDEGRPEETPERGRLSRRTAGRSNGRRKVFVIQTCCYWNYDDDWECTAAPGAPVLAFTTLARAQAYLDAQQQLHPDVLLGIVEIEVEADAPEA
jgi:hypothetical protein